MVRLTQTSYLNPARDNSNSKFTVRASSLEIPVQSRSILDYLSICNGLSSSILMGSFHTSGDSNKLSTDTLLDNLLKVMSTSSQMSQSAVNTNSFLLLASDSLSRIFNAIMASSSVTMPEYSLSGQSSTTSVLI